MQRSFEFVPILVLALLGVAAFRFSRRGRRIVGGDPHCATCGYIVRGLPSPTCPECGADLSRPGGIAHAGGRKSAGTLGRLIGWSAFCLLAVFLPVAFIWWTFLVPHLPRGRKVVQDVRYMMPASGAYQSISITSMATGTVKPSDPDPKPSKLAVTLTEKDGTIVPITVDAATLAYQYGGKAGQLLRGTPLGSLVLEDWLRESGVVGDREKVSSEMKYMEHEIREAAAGRPTGRINHYPEFSGRSSSGSVSTWDLTWVPFVPGVAGGTVWLIGLILILARSGKAHSPVASLGVAIGD